LAKTQQGMGTENIPATPNNLKIKTFFKIVMGLVEWLK
jgi:hypothetical protein